MAGRQAGNLPASSRLCTKPGLLQLTPALATSPLGQLRPAQPGFCQSKFFLIAGADMNKTWFVPPIVIPIVLGLGLAVLIAVRAFQ